MQPQGRTVEERLASLGGVHGIVTWLDLVRAGISKMEIKGRARKGLLIRLHRGVYSVGRRTSPESRYLAAVWACGGGAALSGVAAGWLYGLIKGKPPPPEVTTRTHRRVPGLTTRRCRRLDRRDVATYPGIPVTTVARTLVDLAAVLSLTDLARACHEAGVRYRTTPRHVRAVLERRPNAPGAANIKRVMEGDAPVLLSVLEGGFRDWLIGEGFPLPRINRREAEGYVDCRWRGILTVELESYRFHNSRHA